MIKGKDFLSYYKKGQVIMTNPLIPRILATHFFILERGTVAEVHLDKALISSDELSYNEFDSELAYASRTVGIRMNIEELAHETLEWFGEVKTMMDGDLIIDSDFIMSLKDALSEKYNYSETKEYLASCKDLDSLLGEPYFAVVSQILNPNEQFLGEPFRMPPI